MLLCVARIGQLDRSCAHARPNNNSTQERSADRRAEAEKTLVAIRVEVPYHGPSARARLGLDVDALDHANVEGLEVVETDKHKGATKTTEDVGSSSLEEGAHAVLLEDEAKRVDC